MLKNVLIPTLLLSVVTFNAISSFAQNSTQKKSPKEFYIYGQKVNPHNAPIKRPYITSGIEGHMLSTAIMSRPGESNKLTTPRYTLFWNLGLNQNYNFNKNVGWFIGLSFKNIGFIEKFDQLDSTVKRRVYTLGIPVGLKFGDLLRSHYGFVGFGVDFPFNYKEKGFVKRNDKDKFNEWFSNRTPHVMPYVFVGFKLSEGLSFKLQYYPNNFLNPDFTTTKHGITVKPYAGYKVNILAASVLLNIPNRPDTDMK